MSQSKPKSQSKPESQSKPKSQSQSKPKSEPRHPRKWRRRLGVAAITLGALAVLVRINLIFIVPAVMNAVAADYGLSVEVDDMDFSVLTGEIRLSDLRVIPRKDDGGTPAVPATPGATQTDRELLRVEYAIVDLDVSALFGLQLRVHRLEVDGLDIEVERDRDGRLHWSEHLAPLLAAAPQPATADPAADTAPSPTTTPVDLRLPIRVDALRAQHVRLHILDRSVSPAIDTWLETHVRVSDLGHAQRPARIQLQVHGPDLLDDLTVDGTLRTTEDRVEATLAFAMKGLRPGKAAPWLAAVGLVPHANTISMRSRLVVRAERSKAVPSRVDATLELTGSTFMADDTECLAVDRVRLTARQLGANLLWAPEILVSGMRGQAERLADQTLRIAGFDLQPIGGSSASEPTPPTANPTGLDSSGFTEFTGFTAKLDRLRFTDLRFLFKDGGIDPATELEIICEEFEVADIDTSKPDSDVRIRLIAHLPGILGPARLEGTLRPFASLKTAAFETRAEAITLARLRPYLAALGLQPTLQDGTASCKVSAMLRIEADGSMRAETSVRELRFADTGKLFHLDAVEVKEVVVAASLDRIRIGTVNVAGGTLPATRHQDGSIHLLGLGTIPAPGSALRAQAADAVATSNPTPTPTPIALPDLSSIPRFELGEFRWRGLALSFSDLGVTPPATFATENFDVQLTSFALGGPARPAGTEPDIAKLTATCGVTGVAKQLHVNGTLRSKPGPLDLAIDVRFRGESISLRSLTPYLDGTPIRPVMQGGHLAARLEASLARGRAPGSVSCGTRLSEIAFGTDPAAPALAIAAIEVSDVVLDAHRVRVGKLHLENPTVRIRRNADGSLHALGVRIDLSPLTTGGPAPAPDRRSAAPSPTATSSRFAASLAELEVSEATVLWRDEAVQPTVETDLVVRVDAKEIATNPSPTPTTFRMNVTVADTLRQASVTGEITHRAQAVAGKFDVDGHGLRIGELAAYLPPGLRADVRDGRLGCRIAVQWRRDDQGSQSIAATIEDCSYRDGDGPKLAGCKTIHLAVEELNPAARRLVISNLSVTGLELAIEQPTENEFTLLGLTVDVGELASQSTDQDDPLEATTREADLSTHPATTQTPAGKTGDKSPWYVAIQKLDLGLARLRFRGAQSSNPIDARLRLFNKQPLVLLDARPDELPQLQLFVEGAATPLVDEITASLTLAPWQPDAEFHVDFAVRGIRGNQLPAVLPGVAKNLDLSDLENGVFTAKATTLLRLRRRYPTDLDLRRGFGLNLEVTDVVLRNRPDGEITLGVDAIRVAAPRIVPGGAVNISHIEVSTPRARVHKDAAGLHVAGLTLPQPAAPPEDTETTTEQPANPEPDTDEAGARPKSLDDLIAEIPIDRSAPEIRIDRISVEGLDVVLHDSTVDPPMIVPLTGLDVEISKLTTRALSENRPIHFTINLEAGTVELPERHLASSALAGALAGLGKLAIGQGDDVKLEQRPLLDEIAIQGRLSLFPKVAGRVRTNVQGLELGAMRGAAKGAGVDLSDGVFDAGVDIRLDGAAGLSTRAKFTLGHLSLNEQPGGPISTYLKLPAPLQTVVFALRDEADEIAVPLDIALQDGEIGMGQIATAAVTTFSKLVVNAIAAAPLRVAGSITGLIGLTGGEKTPLATQKQTLAFGPGAVDLDRVARAAVRQIVELLDGDETLIVQLQHQFGAGDMARAQRLANPSKEQARSIADGLRQRRRKLAREHVEAAARARSYYAIGKREAAERSTLVLRRLARERAKTEDALDFILELLRPGAERRRDRRTRKMALGIGSSRLAEVRRTLLVLGGTALANRIEVRRAKLNAIGRDAQVVLVPRARETRE